MNSKNKIWRFFAGKGYYIALILCAVAIGISGYLYYRNATDPSDDPSMNAQSPTGSDVSASVTDPTGGGDSTDPTKPGVGKFKTGSPVSGETVSKYAMDCLTYNPTTRDWRVHNGIDIAAEEGTPVCAAAPGVVYTTYEDEGLGTTVVIRHENGYVTMYSSLDAEVTVAAGDTVELGQQIGYVGSSALLETSIGEHVHFCVTQNDASINPADFFALS
jgi:murein DD-endopeptidase MepM/ murein hydrolase activator NlpD